MLTLQVASFEEQLSALSPDNLLKQLIHACPAYARHPRTLDLQWWVLAVNGRVEIIPHDEPQLIGG